MEKIALITDSTCDLSKKIISKYNIHVLPFRIIYTDREYLDNVTITPKEVYDNMKNEVPTSSMPSMDNMEDLFSKLEKEGYTHAIGITLSTGLSGIYNGLSLVSKNHPNIKTFVYDSKFISMGEGAVVEECGKLIERGESFDEIVKQLPVIRSRIHLFFVVDTLDYLIKGGRIGKVAGTIGKILNVKPIISVDENGVYYTYTKVRGKKQALKRMMNIGDEILNKNKCRVYVMNGNGEDEAKKVYEYFKTNNNASSVDFGGSISPVSGVHSGPGLIGIVFVDE